MKPIERNSPFSNPLIHSSSLYLRQHAQNPVFWYPWGKEAIEKAKAENKPIFLSIGYSTSYQCHVMKREVFNNVSIASLMNRICINIKVDREEHPELDEIYMVARQILTREGGWPNNVFLTPDLKPFHAGGAYAADESGNKTSFPRMLEWLNFAWANQQDDVLEKADTIAAEMERFLVYKPSSNAKITISDQAKLIFSMLDKYHDERAGGFFQSPKFPHENYLEFLLGYHQLSSIAKDKDRALDMVTRSLSRMSAGGIYDHVGCGFHRYAIDKEWYIPHFEKMLYTQALLAKNYTEAARLTGNSYFADIAKSTLEFVSGPMTAGNGAFYSAIDAETNGVEGAHYVWNPEELEKILTKEELTFLTTFYALADVPAFEGHKHPNGQVLIARKPLDVAARELGMPYTQLAALSAEVLNKLLSVRNARPAPRFDDKIIVSWNGLMIDAFATAGKIFNHPKYTSIAQKAANFILENAIDNEGKLHHIFASGKPHFNALLEDYAFLTKGLISLFSTTKDDAMLTAAKDLMKSAHEDFTSNDGGYFLTTPNEFHVFRIKSADDASVPSACATMLHNMLDLYSITGEERWKTQAHALATAFLQGNESPTPELASFIHAALRLNNLSQKIPPSEPPEIFTESTALQPAPNEIVLITAMLLPHEYRPSMECELHVTLNIREGWHLNSFSTLQPNLVPTQLDVEGRGIELVGVQYPKESIYENPDSASAGQITKIYKDEVTLIATLKMPPTAIRPDIKAHLRFQPCRNATHYAARDLVLEI